MFGLKLCQYLRLFYETAIFFYSIFFLLGCVPKINLIDYPNAYVKSILIPDVCRSRYEQKTVIAVSDFKNNSSFTDNNIALAATSLVEDIFSQKSGAKVVSRTDLESVLKEQKLQESGLLSEENLMQAGRLAGAQYIVSGSVDFVRENGSDYSNVAEAATVAGDISSALSKDKTYSGLGLLAEGVLAFSSGYKLEAGLSVKIINVSTAEVIFSKKISDTVSLGNIKPDLKQRQNAVRSAINKALTNNAQDLVQPFEQLGYIKNIKTQNNKAFIAKINLGRINGLKEGDEFEILRPIETVDSLTQKASCELVLLPMTLTISNQIALREAWGLLKTNRIELIENSLLMRKKR